MLLENGGDGPDIKQKVNQRHEALTRSVVQTETQRSNDFGDGFNINTGIINLTDSADSAVLFFKNNEKFPVVIEAIAAGLGTRPSPTETGVLTVIKNPTSGTIIDDVTPVNMAENRNFESPKALSSDTLSYKAVGSGKTFTDGTEEALFFFSGPRIFAVVGFELGVGNSIGLKINTGDSTGAAVYAALVIHIKDGKLQ